MWIFFDQLIRDNIDIGRPDKVSVVFRRQVRRRGKHPTPGTFHTRVITDGVDPSVYVYYKSTQLKQYLKEGKALRHRDHHQPAPRLRHRQAAGQPARPGLGRLHRQPAPARGPTHRPRPADGAAALAALATPVVTSTRVPGLRFTDPRVQALLSALCTLAPLPHGFTNRVLRTHLAPCWA